MSGISCPLIQLPKLSLWTITSRAFSSRGSSGTGNGMARIPTRWPESSSVLASWAFSAYENRYSYPELWPMNITMKVGRRGSIAMTLLSGTVWCASSGCQKQTEETHQFKELMGESIIIFQKSQDKRLE